MASILLVTATDIRERISDIPALTVTTGITDARLEEYIAQESATVLQAAGYTSAPANETLARESLNGVCIKLVINALLATVFLQDAEMKEVLRRERNDLLKELADLAPEASTDGGPFFTLTGGSPY